MPQDAGVSTGGDATFEIEIDTAGKPLKVTLVWTDPPGVQNARVALVNNLDLTVVGPDGQTVMPTIMGANGAWHACPTSGHVEAAEITMSTAVLKISVEYW